MPFRRIGFSESMQRGKRSTSMKVSSLGSVVGNAHASKVSVRLELGHCWVGRKACRQKGLRTANRKERWVGRRHGRRPVRRPVRRGSRRATPIVHAFDISNHMCVSWVCDIAYLNNDNMELFRVWCLHTTHPHRPDF